MAADGGTASTSDRLAKRQARTDLSAVDPPTARKLIAEFERTVRIEVAKVTRRRGLKRIVWMDRDDLLQVGRAAVLEAYVKFKPERGAALATWVTTIVRWRVKESAEMAVDPTGSLYVVYATRKASRRGKATKEAVDRAMERHQALLRTQVLSIHAMALGQDNANGFGRTINAALVDSAPSPEEVVADKQYRDRLYRIIEMLDQRQQMILVAEMHGQSGASLAREIGVTRQRVNDQRKRALTAVTEAVARDTRTAEQQRTRERLTREIADRAALKFAETRKVRRRAPTLTAATAAG